MEKETYTEDLKCGNCDAEETVEIPKGTRVSDFLGHGYPKFGGHACPNCGCTTMHKAR